MHEDGGCGEEESNIVIEGTGKQRELWLEAKEHPRDCGQHTMSTHTHPVYHVIRDRDHLVSYLPIPYSAILLYLYHSSHSRKVEYCSKSSYY